MNSYRKKPNNWRNGIFKNINCNSKMNGVTYREVVADPLRCSRVSCSTFHGSIIGILYVHIIFNIINAIDNLIHLPSFIRYSFCYVYFQILSVQTPVFLFSFCLQSLHYSTYSPQNIFPKAPIWSCHCSSEELQAAPYHCAKMVHVVSSLGYH